MRIRASKFRSVMESRKAGEAANAAIVADYGGGWLEVNTLHSDYPRASPVPAGTATAVVHPHGHPCKCGTELKALLKDWLGIEATPTCSCNAMARKMDTLGPDWCEGEGMASILDVMRAEHGKRWADGRTILPWTDVGARQLVYMACRRSRAKADS